MLSMVIMTVIAIMAIKVFIVIPSSYISNLYYEDHPRLRLGACAYVRSEYEPGASLSKRRGDWLFAYISYLVSHIWLFAFIFWHRIFLYIYVTVNCCLWQLTWWKNKSGPHDKCLPKLLLNKFTFEMKKKKSGKSPNILLFEKKAGSKYIQWGSSCCSLLGKLRIERMRAAIGRLVNTGHPPHYAFAPCPAPQWRDAEICMDGLHTFLL